MKNLGNQISNWSGDAAVKGYCAQCDKISPNSDGSPKNVNVVLFERGLKILSTTFAELLAIDEKQIVSLKQDVEQVQADKSVIGRGIAGGLLLGPVGAIVGGMSGLGKKDLTLYVLRITYNEFGTKEAIFASTTSFQPLINRANKDLKISGKTLTGVPKINYSTKSVAPQKSPAKPTPPVKTKNENTTDKDKIESLRNYKKLLDEGIITQKEFEDKKKAILDKAGQIEKISKLMEADDSFFEFISGYMALDPNIQIAVKDLVKACGKGK